ncbi:aminoglycoside phosphotransferase family protein [Mycolicibacterium parafortuitum]|nr:aminoglycoside phosphotransferase family protein [Mycolicibacterium parafortuitum]ORB30119.1 aminoglycoside phosphotransferase [Mycolicibacterium parafortuitum]
MQTWHRGRLTERQEDVVARWFPDAQLVRDMSWNLVDTAVLAVDTGNGRAVVKAAGPGNRHIGREITAYQGFTNVLEHRGQAPRLLRHDRDANILAIEYLQGSSVEGNDAELLPDTYFQAGELCRAFHEQAERADPDWDAAAVAKSIAWLDKPHRIKPGDEERLRTILLGHRPQPVNVVPTHGDWQPRNWLIDGGTLKVIDFGRFAWRPAIDDFGRLAAQQWRQDDRLERAFFAGYGHDPRTPELWRMTAVHHAVGTAVWAYQVGDEPFEMQGHRMIAEALGLFDD